MEILIPTILLCSFLLFHIIKKKEPSWNDFGLLAIFIIFFFYFFTLKNYPKLKFWIQPKGIIMFEKDPSIFGKKSYGYLKYLNGKWYVDNDSEINIQDIMNIRTNNIIVTQDTIPLSYLDSTFLIKYFNWNKLNLNDRYENARINWEWQEAEKEYWDYIGDYQR